MFDKATPALKKDSIGWKFYCTLVSLTNLAKRFFIFLNFFIFAAGKLVEIYAVKNQLEELTRSKILLQNWNCCSRPSNCLLAFKRSKC